MKSPFHLCIAGSAVSLLPIAIATSDRDFPLYAESTGDVVANLLGGQTYERVYLQYHQCVWSEFGNGVDEYGNGCEGDGNEDLWYVGQTQCYRANVAYSLYGVPYGQNIPKHPCQRKNFINSYFSNHGVEYFSNSMGIDYGDATDTCVLYSQGDDDFYANHKFGGENNGLLYPTYSSYTTACSANGKFVQGLFEGAYCSVRDFIETMATLDDFNDALEEMNCVQVYDAADDGGNFEDDDNDGNRKLEDESNIAAGLSSLLSYSVPCSMLEYPHACPDPHGAKQWFEFLPDSQKPWWSQMNWMDILGCILLFFAVLFVLIPHCYFDDKNNSDNELKKPKKRFCLRRNGNRKKEGKRRFWFRWRRRVDNSSNANAN
eukprot:Nitzschia sp. Nitz4//scaffold83_size84149//53594//54715//NITZ4_005178-RA/size84149-processed-gene-0.63-mRNA-1//-1//CDS//3329558959//2806//frame0